MEWYTFQYSPDFLLVVVIRLLISCFLGGIIGSERESQRMPAGFRTHILVCLGSCLTMLISQFAFIAYEGTVDIDPTRIGAQVVSGIGFLGAGAIIRHGVSVKGITTAASIWADACIGLACGTGFYTGAVIATLLIWLILLYLKTFERRLPQRTKTNWIELDAELDADIIVPLNSLIKEKGFTMNSLEISRSGKAHIQRITCQLEADGKAVDFILLASEIRQIEGVLKVSL